MVDQPWVRPGVRTRPRRALVVLAGTARVCDSDVQTLISSLRELGIDATCLQDWHSVSRIAAAVADAQADTLELCVKGNSGVLLIRELLRELIAIGRRDVSVIVHRVD
jgi:methylmalonyl-CoA mutase cobalamin-binding subunit